MNNFCPSLTHSYSHVLTVLSRSLSHQWSLFTFWLITKEFSFTRKVQNICHSVWSILCDYSFPLNSVFLNQRNLSFLICQLLRSYGQIVLVTTHFCSFWGSNNTSLISMCIFGANLSVNYLVVLSFLVSEHLIVNTVRE